MTVYGNRPKSILLYSFRYSSIHNIKLRNTQLLLGNIYEPVFIAFSLAASNIRAASHKVAPESTIYPKYPGTRWQPKTRTTLRERQQ